ncbi:MAG: PAS domain-containing protein, partial [bacterium]
LGRSERLYRDAIEVVGAVPYFESYDPDTYEFVGEGIRALTGYSVEEFTPEAFDATIEEIELLGTLAGLSVDEAVKEARGEEGISWRADYRIRTREGEERWLANAAVQVRDEHGKVVGSLGIFQDITDRKKADEALRVSEEQYRTTIDSLGDGIHVVDSDLRIILFNSALQERSKEVGMELGMDAIGRPVFDVFPFLPERTGREYQLVFETGKPLTTEEHFKIHGREYTTETRKIPIYEGGKVARVVTVIRDTTEQRKLEEQLRQSQKIEAVGQLAGGVAHNINNLLTGILGNLKLVEMTGPERTPQFVGKARNAAERAAALVHQLLAFSRKSRLEFRVVDLNQIVEEVYRLTRSTIDRRIEIEVHKQEDLPKILADAAQINSILMNLCINARDAINEVMHGQATPERRGDRFVITIWTEFIVIDRRYCESHSYARPGKYVVLGVSDNGAGMDLETRRRVFEPFFTTKEIGRGTGLGLASTYGVVRQHDGWIDLYSEPGKETSFKVYLPVTEQGIQEIVEEQYEEIPGGTETILLVDDEEMIRNLGREALEEYGYTALLAADGQEGLDVYLKERDRIDLTILDLSMPHLSGRELLERLRSVHPHAKVIVSSGYSRNGHDMSLKELNVAGFVAKPYLPADLLRTVRKVLDTPQSH